MASVTLAQFRSRTRERADMGTSQFITDTVDSLDAIINDACDELYDLLVEKYVDYFKTSATFTTVSGTETVSTPATFYKLLGIDLTVGGIIHDLQPYSFANRNAYANSKAGGRPRYSLEQTTIRLLPAPNGAWAGTIWFVPVRTKLVASTDAFAIPGLWEQFVYVAAAIPCVIKEESDPSALMAQKAELKRQIESIAIFRDPGAAPTVVDVYAKDAYEMDPGWWVR